MSIDRDRWVKCWYEHVRYLTEEIGPRGSTREGERLGSAYCERILAGLDLGPKMELFSSARSIYHPHLVSSIGLLIAFGIYPLAGRVTAGIAAVFSVVVIVSELMELGLRNNLLRRVIPKGQSQNVFSIVEPSGEHRQDVVLIGHVDSHRTPIIFSSLGWLKTYGVFSLVAFVAFLVQVALFGLGTVTQWSWIWPAAIPSAVCAVGLAAMCIQADSTPFNDGANDNATAVGIVLALAEHLAERPLEHTRVWAVCTGCEEVQHYGAADFYRRHAGELRNPVSVVFESLGCDGPAWLTKEGIIVPFHADRGLVALSEKVGAEHPELRAYPTKISGGNTEMADSMLAGVPAITICGITREGLLPYWHQPGDTLDKIDREVLGRAYAFTWELLQGVDGRVAEAKR